MHSKYLLYNLIQGDTGKLAQSCGRLSSHVREEQWFRSNDYVTQWFPVALALLHMWLKTNKKCYFLSYLLLILLEVLGKNRNYANFYSFWADSFNYLKVSGQIKLKRRTRSNFSPNLCMKISSSVSFNRAERLCLFYQHYSSLIKIIKIIRKKHYSDSDKKTSYLFRAEPAIRQLCFHSLAHVGYIRYNTVLRDDRLFWWQTRCLSLARRRKP